MAGDIQLLVCPEAEADLYVYRRSRESALQSRIIRGQRCSVIDRCMGELSAALQLPYCFEGAWPSLEQCLADLQWVKGRPLLLVFTSAQRILPRASGDLAQMLAVFRRFGDSGAVPSLEIVLQVEARFEEELRSRLAKADVPIK